MRAILEVIKRQKAKMAPIKTSKENPIPQSVLPASFCSPPSFNPDSERKCARGVGRQEPSPSVAKIKIIYEFLLKARNAGSDSPN